MLSRFLLSFSCRSAVAAAASRRSVSPFNVVSSQRFLSSSPSSSSSSPPSPSASWKILRLNHIALATPGTEGAADFYRSKFHLTPSDKHPQAEHGVNTVFVDVGNTKLELLDQLGDNSPIKAFLSKNASGGIHHLCFEVDNIEAAVSDLKTQGVRLLAERTKIGAHGKPVIFIHPKDCGGVLIELEQA